MSRRLAVGVGLALWSGLVQAQPAPPPELLFQAEAQTLSGTCTGQPVRLEGNHNTLTLTGQCGSLLLKGVGNTVQLGIVPGGAIRVEGSGNRVSYAGAGTAPAVVMLGPDNETASGPAVTPAPAKPAPAPPQAQAAVPPPSPAPMQPPPASPASLAAPVPRPLPAAGPVALAGDDQQLLAACAGRDVVVTGNRSAYVLRGGCRSLTLRGDLLAVQAEMEPGARISVTGRGSIVSWAVPPKSKPPASLVHGEGSRTQRAETIGGDPVR